MCLDTPQAGVQELPTTLTWPQISVACKEGRKLMVVDGEVYPFSVVLRPVL